MKIIENKFKKRFCGELFGRMGLYYKTTFLYYQVYMYDIVWVFLTTHIVAILNKEIRTDQHSLSMCF